MVVNKFKTFVKEHKYLCIMAMAIVLGVLVIYIPSFISGKYYVGGGDIKTQNYEYYLLAKRETLNALKNGTLPFYSFVLFLGNNIWASKPDYLLDPFNIITYILPVDFYLINDFICIVKLLTAGIGTYLVINKIYRNEKAAALGGFLFAMSSYAVYFTSQPAFLSFFAIVPFYLLGIELYLSEKKKGLFIATVFLSFLISYYLFFALTVFTPVYFLYRYYNINGSFKGWFKSALILIVYYLIGCLLSCFSLVPGAVYVLGNDRVGKSSLSFTYDDIKIYLHLIYSRLVPSQSYIYANNVFDNSSHTIREMCLFTSSFVTVVITQLLSDRNKIFRRSTLILYLVMAVLAFVPYGSSLMNGLSEVCFRWTFIVVFIDVLVCSKYFIELESVNRKHVYIIAFISIGIILASFLAAVSFESSSLIDYKDQLIITLITVVALILVSLFITNRKVLTVIIAAEVIIACGYKGYNSIDCGVSKSYVVASETVLSDGRDYNQLNDYLDSLEEGNEKEFYRVYVPFDTVYWANSTNFNIIYNLKGLMTYDSLFAPSFSILRDIVRTDITKTLSWDFDIQNKDLINLYSTKYSITTQKEEIPFDNYEILDYYRDSMYIAKNLDYRPLGVTYTEYMNYWDLEKVYNNDPAKFLDSVVCYYGFSEVMKDEHQHYLHDIEYGNNRLSGYVETDDSTFMVLSLPYEKGWTIKINGNKTSYFECNGGLIGFAVPAGENYVEMSFVPDGFKEGCLLSLVGIILLGIVNTDVFKKVKYRKLKR